MLPDCPPELLCMILDNLENNDLWTLYNTSNSFRPLYFDRSDIPPHTDEALEEFVEPSLCDTYIFHKLIIRLGCCDRGFDLDDLQSFLNELPSQLGSAKFDIHIDNYAFSPDGDLHEFPISCEKLLRAQISTRPMNSRKLCFNDEHTNFYSINYWILCDLTRLKPSIAAPINSVQPLTVIDNTNGEPHNFKGLLFPSLPQLLMADQSTPLNRELPALTDPDTILCLQIIAAEKKYEAATINSDGENTNTSPDHATIGRRHFYFMYYT
uniref:F-box domain-containing protein n=1 Tax=Talaromyces marneffei PM1 TaxID=1077442 RepID=A0A093UQJ7_TALMA